jgi:hypothetical protein
MTDLHEVFYTPSPWELLEQELNRRNIRRGTSRKYHHPAAHKRAAYARLPRCWGRTRSGARCRLACVVGYARCGAHLERP